MRRAETQVSRWLTPTTGKFPLDRLRRQMAHAMRLDVIFSQKLTKAVGDDGKQYWGRTPVWKVAQRVHYWKVNRLSSLLHSVVTNGFRANIVHELVRLSTQIWVLSLKDFTGLCRVILSKIVKALRAYRSSPDPLERMGTLSNNPAINGRVCRNPPAKRKNGDSSRPRPKCLDLLAKMLTCRLRRRVRSTQMSTNHNVGAVRET